MSWNFWRRSRPQHPTLTIQCLPNTGFHFNVTWPKLVTRDQELGAAGDMARLILLLSDGVLLPTLQGAVAHHDGIADASVAGTATQVLANIVADRAVAAKPKQFDDTRPLVTPLAALAGSTMFRNGVEE